MSQHTIIVAETDGINALAWVVGIFVGLAFFVGLTVGAIASSALIVWGAP